MVRKGYRPEALRIRLFKAQRRYLGKVYAAKPALASIRIGKRIMYRQPHIRRAELSYYGAIAKLHHGMDHGLPMDKHAYTLAIYAEEIRSLHYLKPLIEERGRIHRYFTAHLPRWVVRCHLRRYSF